MAGWREWRWVYLAVAAVTLAAHLPEFGGWVSCNPIYRYPSMVQAPLHSLLAGQCSLDGNDGMTLQALGGGAARMWLTGTLPWWNSYAGLGLPLAAEAQPAAFFLPFVLLLHFFAGMLILKVTLQILAGACVVALLRELGIGRAGTAVGGALFALNGTFAWFGDAPILPIAFLPALLFGLERCRTRAVAGRAGGLVWVALALAYSIVAGFPETAFMDGVLAGLWAGTAFVRTPARFRWTLLGKIAGGGVAGLALSAPAWVSFLDYLRISSVGMHAFVLRNYVAPEQAAALIMPSLFGPPYAQGAISVWTEAGGYFGPALVFLALQGCVSGRGFVTIRAVMGGWIVFWLSVFLRLKLSHAVWAALPALDQVWVTRYAMPSMECAAVVLAAIAADDWCKAPRGLRARFAVAAFLALSATSLLFAAQAGRLSSGIGVFPVFSLTAVLEASAVVSGLAWLLARPPERRAVMALAVLVVADAGAQFVVPELAGTTPNRLALAPVRFLQAHAGLSRSYALDEQFPTNYGSLFGVAQIQAFSIPYAQAWADAARAIGGDIDISVTGGLSTTPAMQRDALKTALARLRRAGVRYIVVPSAGDPFLVRPEPGLVAVFADALTRIYDMPGAAPYMEVRDGPCSLAIIARTRAVADCAGPATLLRRELLLPGWHARINGGKAMIASGAAEEPDMFQQVALPAGRSVVEWRYAPPHSGLMTVLWVIGVAAVVGMVLWGARVRRRQGRGSIR